MDLDLQVNLKFRLVVVLTESQERQQCYSILTTQAAEQSSKRPFGASFKRAFVTLWYNFKQFKGQIRTQRPKAQLQDHELAHGRFTKVTLIQSFRIASRVVGERCPNAWLSRFPFLLLLQ